jgi:hypothetical protein
MTTENTEKHGKNSASFCIQYFSGIQWFILKRFEPKMAEL